MQHGKKRRVLVVYGGRSGEHEVALRSAASVLRHLDREKYEIVPIGIDLQGRWHLNPLSQLDLQAESVPVCLPSSHPAGLEDASSFLLKPYPLAEQAPYDVVFPVMHGPLCEDGAIQGFLELTGLPYVGCNVLASAISMDKDVAKRLVAAAGLPVVPWVCVRASDVQEEKILQAVAGWGGFPVFVKPANLGSSVGVSRVMSREQLRPALEKAARYDGKLLVEKAVVAREIELAILEDPCSGALPRVSGAGEIVPQHEFYSYEAKYLEENGALLHIPAPLSEAQTREAQALAQKIFLLLEGEGLARVDLFLDRQTQQFYFNEMNTLPGFTSISMYPQLWQAAGLSYTALLDELIALALHRHERRSQLVRSYHAVS